MMIEFSAQADSYRPRDGFLGGRDGAVEKADGATPQPIPYMRIGADLGRVEIPFDEVFPRLVAGTTLIGDSPAPTEDEPQRRGRQDASQQPGGRSEGYSTAVGSVMIDGFRRQSTTGDWLSTDGWLSDVDDADMGVGSTAVAASEAPRHLVALPMIAATAKAGDPLPAATGEWIGRADDSADRERYGIDLGGGENSYPIASEADLGKAIAAYGRSKPADRAEVRAHIARRAERLGLESRLPDAWTEKRAIRLDRQLAGV